LSHVKQLELHFSHLLEAKFSYYPGSQSLIHEVPFKYNDPEQLIQLVAKLPEQVWQVIWQAKHELWSEY